MGLVSAKSGVNQGSIGEREQLGASSINLLRGAHGFHRHVVLTRVGDELHHLVHAVDVAAFQRAARDAHRGVRRCIALVGQTKQAVRALAQLLDVGIDELDAIDLRERARSWPMGRIEIVPSTPMVMVSDGGSAMGLPLPSTGRPRRS